jgi:hypothetical protein
MRFVIQIRAEKAPKTEEEKQFLAETLADGRLEQWVQEAEAVLRENLQEELDQPDTLDVRITVVEDGQEDDCNNGCGCPGSCQRAIREEWEQMT